MGCATTTTTATAAGHRPGAAKRRAAAIAKAALLRRSDLRGWSATPAAGRVPSLTCDGFDPDLKGFEPLAAAASPTFSDGGRFVSQDVYAFDAPRLAGGFWRRVVRRRLETCLAGSLRAGSGEGVTFTPVRRHGLSLPRIGDRDAGFRVVGTGTTSYQSVTLYLDMLVVSCGSAISAISLSSLSVAPSRVLELRLARAVARRLPRT